MVKRLDEEFCRSKFHTLLQERLRYSPEQIRWEEVRPWEEPPDYYLWVEGQKFAVEVTSIVEMLPLEPNPVSSVGVSSALRTFVDKIEAQAKQQGILQGVYVISLQPLHHFQQVKDLLSRLLLQYIRETRSVDKAPSQVVFQQRHARWAIQKIAGGGDNNYVGEIISFDGKWEGEAFQELCVLIQRALSTKATKLRRLTLPIILLLLDRYHYVDPPEWQACVQRLFGCQQFHTVAHITEHGAKILCSLEHQWAFSG